MDGMKKVEDLEKTLFNLKMQANSLTIGIRDVEKELQDLKRACGYYSQSVPRPVQQPVQQPIFRDTQVAPQAAPQKAPVTPQNGSSTESWIGKILMGVFASLLVFIALITFAKLIMPYITEAVKIVLMFVASIAMTVTGYVLNKKKPKNTFFAALLACGTACVYLSIVVTKVHFGAISPIIMYILLAAWAGVILFLGRERDDWLFFVIGNLGYLVSSMFATKLPEESLIIPMLIYLFVVAAAYQIAFWKNNIRRSIQTIVNAASLLIFEVSVIGDHNGLLATNIVVAVTLSVILIQYIIYLFADLKEFRARHFAIASINLLFFLIAFITYGLSHEVSAIVVVLTLIGLGALMELANILLRGKGIKNDEAVVNAVFSAFLFVVAAALSAINSQIIYDYGILLLCFALIAVYGMIRKDMVFKAQGWAIVVYCMVLGVSVDSGNIFEFVAIGIAIAAFAAEAFVFNNSVIFKILSYLQLLMWIMRLGYLAIENTTLVDYKEYFFFGAILVIAVVNATLKFVRFYVTLGKENDRLLHLTLDVINVAVMAGCMTQMSFTEIGVLKAFYMCLLVLLACLNFPVGENATQARMIYTGLKFGVILFYSLTVYNTPDFIISVCMILFAVICIIIGFRYRNTAKSLRIFGLVLTILFVVKFIVVDISFDSSVTKALSFLAAGILCFGISAIYNHFEKQGQNAG